ncbi:MAG: SAM-dependent methyltransferase, partial [Clostridiales bacterium]|nr:SAM-dependent methyltransferase [Clostridiales bacterium]
MRFSRVLKAPSLDERLSAAVRCFPVCDTGADIGADHGKLACWLLLNNRCNRMIVSDISAKALKRAER